MRPLESVLLRLQQQGVGNYSNMAQPITLFGGTGVDVPNTGTIITVTETGGPKAIGTHNAGSLKQPSFQVVARSSNYLLAAAKIDQAYAALGGEFGLKNLLVGTVFWLYMNPMSEPFTLPLDANGRNRVAFNVETLRR